MTAGERPQGGQRRPSRLALGLLLLFVVNSLLVNWALPRLPSSPQQTTTLGYTQVWLERQANSDSWRPMRAALRFEGRQPEEPLYTRLFFERKIHFQYPPSSLLVLELLQALPVDEPISNRTLNGISWWAVLLLAVAVARIFGLARRRYGVAPASASDEALFAVLAFGITLCFYPVVRGYYLGQIQTWIDLLVAGVLWAWLEDRKRVAGVLFSLVCLIKPTLALVALWGLLRREGRFLAGFAAPMALFALLSLALYGWDNHVDYLRVLSYLSRHGEVFHANQSMNGVLNRMFGNGDSLVWDRDLLLAYDPWVHAGTLASSLVLVGLALWAAREGERRLEPLGLGIAIVCSTLAAPTAWTHHYGVTLPVFALALPAVLALDRNTRRMVLLSLTLSFLLVSNNYRLLNRLHDTPFNLLQSVVYFGGLLLLAVLLRTRAGLRARAAPAVAS